MDTNLLSDREIEVLRLVGQGKSNKEIAMDLDISVNTVKVHIGRIFQKINVTSRTEATLFAIEHGIIKSPANQIEEEDQKIPVVETQETKSTWQDIISRKRWLFLAFGLLILAALYVVIAKPAFLMPRQNPAEIPPQNWVDVASMTEPRSSMAIATFEGKIIAIGGRSSLGVLSSVEMYDPISNTWSTLKEKPTAVYDASAAVIGEKIYIPGGVKEDGSLTNIVEVFNPRKNEWENVADLPIPISGYGLASYEGQIFLFGGWDGQKPLDSVWRYDPNTDTWHPGSPMLTARLHPAVLADGGKIYVMGGSDGVSKLSTNESYSPYIELEKENPWKVEPDLPEKLSGYTAIKLYDKVAVIGGKSVVSGAIDQFHYSTVQREWQIININSEPASPILDAAYVLLGDNIYVIGGQIGEEYLDRVSRYQAVFTILLPLTIN
jgi:DNA-binding CsgD family transcriptional regulator